MKVADAAVPAFVNKTGARTITSMSVRSLDLYRQRGMLAYYRIGGRVAFKVADLVAFMEQRRVDCAGDSP